MKIEYIVCLLGLISIVYFIIRTAVVRPDRLRFSVFWVVSGTAAIAVSVLSCLKGNAFMAGLCYVAIVAYVIMALGIICVAAFAHYENRKSERIIPSCVLILGVHYPSEEFELRVAKAAELWLENREATMVCSGGKGEDEPLSEAAAMKAILMEGGVPEENIRAEEESRSTYQNLKNVSEIIGSRSGITAIVTSDYHAMRTIILAKKAGLRNVAVASAVYFGISWVNYAVRELLLIPLEIIRTEK